MQKSLHNSLTTCSELAIVGPLPICPQLTSKEMPFIYLDGGLRHRVTIKNSGFETFSFSIGDNDSFQGDASQFDILLQKDKDLSDFAAALQLIAQDDQSNKDLKTLHLYGLLGQRLDHQLAIFGELSAFISQRNCTNDLQAFFYSSTSNQDIEVILFSGHLQRRLNGTFSIMALTDSIVSASGQLKYPLKKHRLKALSSLGLSNQSLGMIEIESSNPTLLIMPKEE